LKRNHGSYLLPNQPTNHYSRLLKRGHFYVAEKRTFLFGIDSIMYDIVYIS